MKQDSRSHRKILLVDDDTDDRQYFSEALQEIDPAIELVTAKDGLRALEILREPGATLPDLIFMDLRMPRVNGRQCLLELKADERLKHLPVFIYTTSENVAESEELQSLGALRFISKPTDPEEIYYVITQALEEQWNDQDNSAG